MNKVLKISLVLCTMVNLLNGYQKFLTENKEILTSNNIDQVYQTNLQKEYLATSDFKCVFRCGTEINEKQIEHKYQELNSNLSEKSIDTIKNIDIKYYCNSVKPLYVVYLTPDVKEISQAEKLCNAGTSIFSMAEVYCKKDKACSVPTVEII